MHAITQDGSEAFAATQIEDEKEDEARLYIIWTANGTANGC
jgi:hypothetical protein